MHFFKDDDDTVCIIKNFNYIGDIVRKNGEWQALLLNRSCHCHRVYQAIAEKLKEMNEKGG